MNKPKKQKTAAEASTLADADMQFKTPNGTTFYARPSTVEGVEETSNPAVCVLVIGGLKIPAALAPELACKVLKDATGRDIPLRYLTPESGEGAS